MSHSTARQRRIYRARSAGFLATLDTSCSVDDLLTIDWAALETLPLWCFFSPTEKKQLQLLCGGLFMAPIIQRWIDGRRIQSLRELIGGQAYEHVRQFAPLSEHPVSADVGNYQDMPETESMLLDAGAAVCIGAIQHPVIADILIEQFAQPKVDQAGKLASNISQPLYNEALALFDRLQLKPEASGELSV